LKLESSHRRTIRRRRNGIETGVFLSILISSFRFCCWLIFLRFPSFSSLGFWRGK
jgi:hypothetical protein